MTLTREQVAERLLARFAGRGARFPDSDEEWREVADFVIEAEDAKAAEMRERCVHEAATVRTALDGVQLDERREMIARLKTLPLRPDAGTPGDATEAK